jgi:hypothetical protein
MMKRRVKSMKLEKFLIPNVRIRLTVKYELFRPQRDTKHQDTRFRRKGAIIIAEVDTTKAKRTSSPGWNLYE